MLKVYWLNLFAKFSVIEHMAGVNVGSWCTDNWATRRLGERHLENSVGWQPHIPHSTTRMHNCDHELRIHSHNLTLSH